MCDVPQLVPPARLFLDHLGDMVAIDKMLGAGAHLERGAGGGDQVRADDLELRWLYTIVLGLGVVEPEECWRLGCRSKIFW